MEVKLSIITDEKEYTLKLNKEEILAITDFQYFAGKEAWETARANNSSEILKSFFSTMETAGDIVADNMEEFKMEGYDYSALGRLKVTDYSNINAFLLQCSKDEQMSKYAKLINLDYTPNIEENTLDWTLQFAETVYQEEYSYADPSLINIDPSDEKAKWFFSELSNYTEEFSFVVMKHITPKINEPIGWHLRVVRPGQVEVQEVKIAPNIIPEPIRSM